jgi:acetylornithine deacetylase/succinyl-diaminopimelate desuccinylase-like protein
MLGAVIVRDDERAVCEDIDRRAGELLELLEALIALDTTARARASDPARQERLLQELLAARLSAAGAEVDLWEPSPGDAGGTPMVPEPIGFEGRPQLAARLAGQGDGRHLILNGHIDVVDVEPRGRWTTPAHRATLRDGRVYGRGACDMKGGIAAMVVAAEAVARLGVLGGDLTVCTVTDEESTGAGGLAAVSHGVRGDGMIVTEPTGLAVWRACRGTLIPTVTVEGRPGHAGGSPAGLAGRRRGQRDREDAAAAGGGAPVRGRVAGRSRAPAPGALRGGVRALRAARRRLAGHLPGPLQRHLARRLPARPWRGRRLGRRRPPAD